MEKKLLITQKEKHIISALLEEGKITGLSAQPLEHPALLGNVYVGKVKNIVKNINAAFVEFEKGRMGYLPLEKKEVPIHTDSLKREDQRILIGDEIIVQVVREAVKTKPPTLSCSIDFSGKYLVLCTGKKGISISKKISEKAEKERLRNILKPYESEEYEIIARTNSRGMEKAPLLSELERLKKRYEKVIRSGKHKTVFSRLYEEAPAYLENIKNFRQQGEIKIETDSTILYEQITTYLEENHWSDTFSVSLWDEEHGKFSVVYNIDRTIEHALRKKVWLKSGGYLVIEPTEALVSIDVNTGKAVNKKKDVQKHFLKINREAATEIALQLRLRNLSGMILVDFIDMKDKEAQKELMQFFKQELSKDTVPVQLVDMTKLGLVEVTRKKLRKPLYEEIRSNDIEELKALGISAN